MNIKVRLSLLFTVAVEMLLVVCFVLLYLTIAADRKQDFFHQLHAKSLAVADVFFEADELDKNALTLARQRFRSTLSSSQVMILDSLDRCIYINDSAYTTRSSLFQPIVLDSAFGALVSRRALGQARRLGTVYYEEPDFQAVYLLHPDEHNNYLIIVRAFDDAGAHLLSDVRFILVVSALLMPVVAFALGWWFARNALAPVAAMTAAANDISPANLHKRLPEGAGTDELSNLAKAFNKVFARLERSHQAQRQFIAHASHELRTPLTVMEGEISVTLLQERSAEDYQHTLKSVHNSLSQLNTVTKNLLLLATVEAGAPRQTMSVVCFDEILYNAIDTAQTLHKGCSVVVRDTTERLETLMVACYRELLQTAIVNLLDNAVKFSPANNAVTIHLEATTRELSCSIADNGVGIATEDIPRIFSPFYRSEHTQSVRGSGIGLALVKAIVNVHQGEVQLTSTLGKGTTVTLALPLTQS
jgi:signal transduction histidine kinase